MPPPLRTTARPSTPLRERILDVMALYPEPRSAIIPALRLAQDEYGWLSTEALEAVADATGFTPALRQVGGVVLRHVPAHAGRARTRSASARTSRARSSGPARRCASSSAQLGIHAGQTTPDGRFTLRTVECYGGCGWGPVVSVDERYHEPCGPDQVEGILRELRGDA